MASISPLITSRIATALDAIKMCFKHPIKITLVLRGSAVLSGERELVMSDDDIPEVIAALQRRVDALKNNETALKSPVSEA
jgi:hypothetical protein